MIVNGSPVGHQTLGATRLIDLLRGELSLTGTKEACGLGECGACTVLVDGVPLLACATLVAQVSEATVETIEGVRDESSALRREIAARGGVQCGFCTPGQVMSALALLRRRRALSEAEIRTEMAGNLCRCTGYAGIVAAIRGALGEVAERGQP